MEDEVSRSLIGSRHTFGLKRGVGVDTISEFLVRLRLERQVGCSPSALRKALQALEAALLETATTWETEGCAGGEAREIIGAVDETFLEQMMLVFMDLRTGYLLLEGVAKDRTYATWKAGVEERLAALKTGGRSLVSDRAKALIQLAEQGLECLSMPDFFHCMHDLVKSYSLAIGRRVRQAHHDLKHAEEGLSRQPPPDGRGQDAPTIPQPLEAQHAEVRRWERVHSLYRQYLEGLSLTLHPFHIDDSTPQTSAQVHTRLHAAVDAIATLAQEQQLPARHDAMKKVRKQLPALTALVDFWWRGVEQDFEHAATSSLWRTWAKEVLLPWVSWEYQVAHTRCARRKATLRQAAETRHAVFRQHALTLRLPALALEAWCTWARQQVQAFQRTSSAVEGRNGALARLHHNQRGLPQQRYKVWTVLHNFDCRAADGATPASRFFQRTFPDLFETVLSQVKTLPLPRQRKHAEC